MSYIGNSPGVASQRVTTTLTATAGQTQFTTQSGYVLGCVDVYLNGAKLVNGSDFEAITGTYITLFSGASAGDVVELVSYVPRGLSDGYTKAEADAKFLDVGGDTASGSLALAAASLTGNLTLSGGTANGIGYLNASKVLTTDSTLLYDGSALTLGGSAPLLRSNMSGTQSTRFGIQNSTTNGNTRFYLYPNGTGNISAINMWNNSDPNAANYSSLDIAIIGTQDLRFSSIASGTGTYLPFTWWIGGSEAMRFNTTGLGIGTTSPLSKLHFGTTTTGAVTTPVAIRMADDYSNNYLAANSKFFLYNIGGSEIYGFSVGPASDIQYHSGGAANINGKHVWYAGNTERMRIDTGGYVLINNTYNPNNHRLVVGGDLAAYTSNDSAGSTALRLGSSISMPQGIAAIFGIKTAVGGGYLAFHSASGGMLTEAARVADTGYFGIGSTSPTRALEVKGAGTLGTQIQVTGTTDSAGIKLVPASGNSYEVQATNSSQWIVYDRTNSAYRLAIDSSGNTMIGTTSVVTGVSGSETSLNVKGNASGKAAAVNVINNSGSGTMILGIGESTVAGFVGTTTNHSMIFQTNNVERARIDSAGSMSINTSSVYNSAKLSVNGKISAGDNSATGGSVLIESQYGAGTLGLFGTEYSSGGAVMAYGMRPANNAAASFKNAYGGGGNLTYSAITVADGIRFYTSTGQTLALNADVTISERMRLTTTGSLVLGHNAGWGYTTDQGSIVLSNGGPDTPNVMFLTGTNKNWGIDSWNSAGSNAQATQYLRFVKDINEVGGSMAVTISPAGNIGLGGAYDNTGVGIKFPAAQAASSDANTLDDYEEGSWSPVLTGTSGGSYNMMGVTAGKYTKVGNVVTATCTLEWDSSSAAFSGNLCVSGLPFTSSGVRVCGSMGAVSSGITFSSGYGEWIYLCDPGYNFVYIIQNSTSGQGYSHTPNVASSGRVYALTITYFTA